MIKKLVYIVAGYYLYEHYLKGSSTSNLSQAVQATPTSGLLRIHNILPGFPSSGSGSVATSNSTGAGVPSLSGPFTQPRITL